MSSLRKYATIEEVEEFADITSVVDEEFEDRISQCEEIIDAYLGPQQKHVSRIFTGKATSVSGKTIIDTSSDTPLGLHDDYFSYCIVEIIGGTGSGQQRKIESSNFANKSITVETNWSTLPDTTSVYKIYQLSKFPRSQDVYFDSEASRYYKSIPEALKRAVAAQMAFLVNKGDDFFAGDGSEFDSEQIGNYSYSKSGSGANSQASIVKLVAPRARVLLRGYKKSGGRLIADNPTWL